MQPENMQRIFMNGKPVIYRDAKSVLDVRNSKFQEKQLCDGIVFNLGDACVFNCAFCYVSSFMLFHAKPLINDLNEETDCSFKFEDVVIRRTDAVEVLRGQLLKPDGTRIYPDDEDRRVAYSSTVVDVAANMELLRETAAACNLILDNTGWEIRLLSKSNLLNRLIADRMIPERHHQRIMFGFSTGTLDNQMAKAFESGTALVSKRLQSLHWLQDRGLRTFGMICPSLPQDDYDGFSREICAAINVDKCEHVWAEIINVRGASLNKTLESLRKAGFNSEADRLAAVSGPRSQAAWEDYSRRTFLAHTRNIAPEKLRFLQYVDKSSVAWWSEHCRIGAVPLGKLVEEQNITAKTQMPTMKNHQLDQHRPPETKDMQPLTKKERAYLEERERIVTTGVRASIAAAKALFEIHNYDGGRLWYREFPSFEAYCRARWQYGKTHSYRLVECGSFVADLEKEPEAQSPNGDWLPKSEGQIRSIGLIPRVQRVPFWRKIHAETEPGKLTAIVVTCKAKEHLACDDPNGQNPPIPKSANSDVALGHLRKLSDATCNHANRGEITKILNQVEELLRGS